MERRSSARLSGGAAAAAETRRQEGTRPTGRPSDATAAALRRERAAERAREVEDSPRVLRDKCRRLARALRNAKHLVVYTGAGISTAADIPDYRGPRGVWTRLQRGETVGRVEVSRATPTFTHMALTALWARGTLKFVVSQNCDGLHLRSGLPRRALAELHGDMFAERCAACRRVYLRAFDTTERTARHAHGTRRLCHACGLELRDTIVHFGERGRAAWPLNWAGALRHAAAADVILCLGSSLKVLRRYPRLWCMQRAPRDRPALYIVNLQWTPKDAVASLKINARCDTVMAEVARRLRLRVPRYRPSRDPLLAHATPLAPPEAHTTRRPLLRAPVASDESDADSSCEPTSPSASDTDEELPLRCLAERLRDDHSILSPDRLRSFRVNMQAGEATILLRSEHAPSAVPPPPEPPPEAAMPRCSLSDLRRFRMPKRPLLPTMSVGGGGGGATVNGHAAHHDDLQVAVSPKRENETKEEMEVENGSSNPWRLFEYEQRLKTTESKATAIDSSAKPLFKLEPKREFKIEIKSEMKEESNTNSSEEETRAALAAEIIRRAVLMCRASLYSGLHTIIAPAVPPTVPPAAGDCVWCTRRFAARRCLWYPPAATPLATRAWRRVRGRRQLCACCGERDAPQTAVPVDPVSDGGWYGKGYRKGRRRRR